MTKYKLDPKEVKEALDALEKMNQQFTYDKYLGKDFPPHSHQRNEKEEKENDYICNLRYHLTGLMHALRKQDVK